MSIQVLHGSGVTECLPSSIIPKNGEVIQEIFSDGTKKIKIGDGIHTFSELPYEEESEITVSWDNVEDKPDPIEFEGVYNSSTNKATTKSYVDNAVSEASSSITITAVTLKTWTTSDIPQE